jgi:uncharacterized protein YceK
MTRSAIRALSALLFLALAGCATSMTTKELIFEPYAGTKLDTYVIQSRASSSAERLGAIVDYPFSFVADTALLGVSFLASPDLVLFSGE